ncbi:hypothetical protein ACFV8Z_54670, partial [Streptomyces sp. NPDC059837]
RTGRTRTIPTTRRGAVPGVADQTGLSKHALVGRYLGARLQPRLPETALRPLLGMLALAVGVLYAVQALG